MLYLVVLSSSLVLKNRIYPKSVHLYHCGTNVLIADTWYGLSDPIPGRLVRGYFGPSSWSEGCAFTKLKKAFTCKHSKTHMKRWATEPYLHVDIYMHVPRQSVLAEDAAKRCIGTYISVRVCTYAGV